MGFSAWQTPERYVQLRRYKRKTQEAAQTSAKKQRSDSLAGEGHENSPKKALKNFCRIESGD